MLRHSGPHQNWAVPDRHSRCRSPSLSLCLMLTGKRTIRKRPRIIQTSLTSTHANQVTQTFTHTWVRVCTQKHNHSTSLTSRWHTFNPRCYKWKASSSPPAASEKRKRKSERNNRHHSGRCRKIINKAETGPASRQRWSSRGISGCQESRDAEFCTAGVALMLSCYTQTLYIVTGILLDKSVKGQQQFTITTQTEAQGPSLCVCVCVCVGMFMWFMRTQICIMTWV